MLQEWCRCVDDEENYATELRSELEMVERKKKSGRILPSFGCFGGKLASLSL
jgi:hypothetical protein